MTSAFVHATLVVLTASFGQISTDRAFIITPDLFSTEVATVVTRSAELHADASLSQPVVDRLMQGDEAVVIFVQGDWLKVCGSSAREGWLERANTSTSFVNIAASDILAGRLDSGGR